MSFSYSPVPESQFLAPRELPSRPWQSRSAALPEFIPKFFNSHSKANVVHSDAWNDDGRAVCLGRNIGVMGQSAEDDLLA